MQYAQAMNHNLCKNKITTCRPTESSLKGSKLLSLSTHCPPSMEPKCFVPSSQRPTTEPRPQPEVPTRFTPPEPISSQCRVPVTISHFILAPPSILNYTTSACLFTELVSPEKDAAVPTAWLSTKNGNWYRYFPPDWTALDWTPAVQRLSFPPSPSATLWLLLCSLAGLT